QMPPWVVARVAGVEQQRITMFVRRELLTLEIAVAVAACQQVIGPAKRARGIGRLWPKMVDVRTLAIFAILQRERPGAMLCRASRISLNALSGFEFHSDFARC